MPICRLGRALLSTGFVICVLGIAGSSRATTLISLEFEANNFVGAGGVPAPTTSVQGSAALSLASDAPQDVEIAEYIDLLAFSMDPIAGFTHTLSEVAVGSALLQINESGDRELALMIGNTLFGATRLLIGADDFWLANVRVNLDTGTVDSPNGSFSYTTPLDSIRSFSALGENVIISGNAAVVPEPSTVLLVMLGLVALGASKNHGYG